MNIIKPNVIANTAEFSRASSGRYRNRLGLLVAGGPNVARFHYRGENEACVLLVEAAAVNGLLRSEEFDNASWVKTNATVTANGATDPAGTTLADKLVETAANAEHYAYQARAGSNETATFSVFAKAAERSRVKLRFSNFASASLGAVFDLATGTVLSVDATSADYSNPVASIEPWGLGWYRCRLTVTKGAVNATNNVQINLVSGSSLSYAGDGASGVYLFGAQAETGGKMTSYIPTTSGTASRSADTIPAGCKFISNLPEADYAAWAAGTLYSTGDRVISTATHKVYEALRGNKGAVTITQATPGVVSFPSHGFPANRKGRFTTTGALPSPLAAGTDYYVTAANLNPDSFTVSLTPGGTPINTTTAGSGVHTFLDATNIGYDPTVAANTVKGDTSGVANTVMWLEVGATNRWKMFDNSASGQTSQSGAIEFAILPGQITALGLVNISATKGSVTMQDPIDGLVDARTFALLEENVFDWLQYFIAPATMKTDYIVDNLPAYNSGIVTVSLTNSTALCGEVVAGLKQTLGRAQWGAKPGITSFGKKETDAYGTRFLKPGNYQKRLTVDVFVENDYADEANRLMTLYRETPMLWIGDKNKTSTIVYGFYNDYDLVLQSIAGSFLTADIEGL